MSTTTDTHSLDNLNKYSEYQSVKNQVPTVFKAFFDEPKTMKEVELDTNIDRAHICRYVATFLKENRIAFLYDRKCRATGSLAGAYTTNPVLFPTSNQLSIFDEL
jgi:hypothetical protein